MSKLKLNITMEDFYAVENLRCKNDVSWFIEEYVKIEDRDSKELARD